MNKPKMPMLKDEAERLAMLKALNILDTAPEAAFDRITRLAAYLLQVPIALVSLIDEKRQWFKSRFGLEAQETPREYAFCAYAIAQAEPMIVPDASRDLRFANNPLVTDGPHIRFYVGVPLRTTNGLPMGTLCALDQKPRELSQEQLKMLTDLAAIANKEIQLRETIALTQTHFEHSQKILAASEARFRTIFEKAAVGIALISETGKWLDVNNDLCEIVGYTKEELLHLTFQDITHPDDLDIDLGLLHQLIRGEIDRYELDKRYIRKDGSTIWINLNVSKQTDDSGKLEHFVAVIHNIQAKKEAEESLEALHRDLEKRVRERTAELSKAHAALAGAMGRQLQYEEKVRQSERELRMVIENANDAYVAIDQQSHITAWNREAENTFGWTATEAIGQPLDIIIPHHMQSAHHVGLKTFLETGNAVVLGKRLELPAVRKDGKVIAVEVRISVLEMRGQTMFSAFLHDISERKQAEAIRDSEARHDALTGLFNRRAFLEMLPLAMARADRSGEAMGILFIDLDGFKLVNDTFGHDGGDVLLQEVAKRLGNAVRQTDSVVRLAGDEFVVMLEGLIQSEGDARLVAEKILSMVNMPISLGEQFAQVSASIGIAIHVPSTGNTPEQLIKAADKAMYEAKHAGKKQIVLAH